MLISYWKYLFYLTSCENSDNSRNSAEMQRFWLADQHNFDWCTLMGHLSPRKFKLQWPTTTTWAREVRIVADLEMKWHAIWHNKCTPSMNERRSWHCVLTILDDKLGWKVDLLRASTRTTHSAVPNEIHSCSCDWGIAHFLSLYYYVEQHTLYSYDTHRMFVVPYFRVVYDVLGTLVHTALVVTRFNTEAPYGVHRQQFPLLINFFLLNIFIYMQQ